MILVLGHKDVLALQVKSVVLCLALLGQACGVRN